MPHPDPFRSLPADSAKIKSQPTKDQQGFVFDAEQQYQLNAINAVLGLFAGQPKNAGLSDLSLQDALSKDSEETLDIALETARSSGVIGNQLVLSHDVLLSNLQKVQERNDLEVAEELKLEESSDEPSEDPIKYSLVPHYEIEMETGTGKTYVYLRTIFELAKKYGFTKFVIVVPNVAIREGVKASIRAMRSHFEELYNQDGITFDETVYSGDKPEQVYSFAVSTNIQILIANISGINGPKESRIIHQQRDSLSGLAPIDYIRATNPIVFLDEPQRMEAEKSAHAVSELNPLCVLRYSATHKGARERNKVYRLDPVDAFNMHLVKQISVSEVQMEGADTNPYIRLVDTFSKGGNIRAKVELITRSPQGVFAMKTVAVKRRDRLSQKAKNDVYDGIFVDEISLEDEGYIELAQYGKLRVGESIGDKGNEQVHRAMIQETIRQHLKKELMMHDKGIKVLSLFFVDSVKKYLGSGNTNTDANGEFVRWFDELYREEVARISKANPDFKAFYPFAPSETRRAYFSQLKTKKNGVPAGTYVDTQGTTKEDDDSYELIMKDKERLLSFEEPVRFIFSHSALREGWDNPNVFQICVLRDMASIAERRQTIGRGLRLPVRSENGQLTRVPDRDIARLIVIANESYQDFADGLQKEYRNDNILIGCIRKTEFSSIPLLDSDGVVTDANLGYSRSREIYDHLLELGMISSEGEPTDKYRPDETNFTLELPEPYAPYEEQVMERLSNVARKDRFVTNAKNYQTRVYTEGFYEQPAFKALWQRIAMATRYTVDLDSTDLADEMSSRLREDAEVIRPISVSVQNADLLVERRGINGKIIGERAEALLAGSYPLPDILKELQQATHLSRQTIVTVLRGSGQLKKFIENPNEFTLVAKKVIKGVLEKYAAENVIYEVVMDESDSNVEMEYITRAEGQMDQPKLLLKYDQLLMSSQEAREYPEDKLYPVGKSEKTDYNKLVLDSEVEKRFVDHLNTRDDVKLYIELPKSFKLDTPAGGYNPDWAILKKEDDGNHTVYLVRETKGNMDSASLRDNERAKIMAARKHYKAVNEVTLQLRESNKTQDELPNKLPKADYGKSAPEKWNI